MKVRFKQCRTLLNFDQPVVKDTVAYATVGIDVGTTCDVNTISRPCSGSGAKVDYVMIFGTNFGIDKATFDHWVERGRVEIL